MAEMTVFCCYNSLYGSSIAAKTAGKAAMKGVHKIEVACSSRVEAIHILKAFENGADGVLIIACPERDCRLMEGSLREGKRVNAARRLLAEAGLEPERIMIVRPDPPTAPKFASIVKEAEAVFDKLGPSPLNQHREAEK